MPLQAPILDDRSFQDIVDEAKHRIPQYCPEWTDHNLSDPGVALIELFAWMTEMLLYRVNQVPDKSYIKFLELLGIKLEPPRSARAPVTFYLSAPQPNEIVIPKGTEVATVRTETEPAIVFTTEADIPIRPPTIVGAFTRSVSTGKAVWTAHDLKRLDLPNQFISLFPNPPVPHDAFYLAFEKDHSQHLMALVLACDNAGGAGIDPEHPPIEWQVYQGGSARWAPCVLEHDGTKGFNHDGEVILHLPHMALEELPGTGTRTYWLRCLLTDAQAQPPHYDVSPRLKSQPRIEARGGTATARHATTIKNEGLGYSNGAAGQAFKLLNPPILSRDKATDYLVVELPGGQEEHWQEVEDFADSGPDDRHFTIDDVDGTLALGPCLLQPDGSVYRFGATPPKGSTLCFSCYQHGGGVSGNVPKGALSVPKSSIPYVSYVSNRQPAVGGRDAQSLADAKVRAPRILRTWNRAVTASDYEYLACQVPGVARARCVAAGPQPGDPSNPKPGQVFVIILPTAEVTRGYIPPERLVLSAELRDSVLSHLIERCLLGCQVDVRPPQYTWLSVQAELRVAEASEPALVKQVHERAEAELYRYLNPYTGGLGGHGWPFGRALHTSEIHSLLQGVSHVEFVEAMEIRVGEPGAAAPLRVAPARLVLPKHGVVCSLEHRVTVTRGETERYARR
jgi:predicted phage baseplate assembly protein